MKQKVTPVPAGFHTATPYLVVRDAARAIEFYKQAFGAKEIFRMPAPDGKIMHGEIQIGDSRVMLSDECPDMGSKSPQALNGSPVSIFLYVEDVDAVFKNAVAAGAKPTAPVQDMFWGDRYGKVTDPFGHQWQIATHKEDVSPHEMEKRSAAAFSKA
jgi:PhnB protein